MDRIIINKMAFYGYHGVFPEETRLGQRFIVDLTVETDLKKAGESDHLEDSINYGELYQVCKDVVEGKPLKLIEAVAEKIAGEMLDRFHAISQVTVRMIKPDPPIPGHYESVAVEITRGR
ncbi:dihydroneopterin aldolase [Cytobacillus dafuensis]|uniref:7,8-dihydroneopterin aldolase n=1 Tax=Cytobacillus dafuensis TaxID=1742359 RepID=A0A5B8Z2T3_CYTDA|nr:dihydroneopterin aldolase [Cytobacillus dafuensis]QED45909.1 dihydroneopterin aldolase [Cytobacillus dafuensis]